ncbi:MAG TPA: glycine cleavage T C-terminal barrel domain-containing protein [Anaeromyxobacteraceae bacterium]|nr:glycine cleavage T C-terminal barrel domain-containing protein [Anaeromyxobacteraceae bacterium]
MTTTSLDRIAAARARLGVGPVQRRALWRATGKDARDYLHRMSTQAVNPLAPGQGAYACFLDAKGHLLGEGHLLVEADGVLLDLDPQAAPAALAQLEKLVIMDDVTFEDRSATHRVVPLLGPEAAATAAGRAPGAPVLANGRRGLAAVDVVLPSDEAEAWRAALVEAGAAPLEEGDLEVLRILGGFARFGHDMDATRLPMEAGLTRAGIAFDKGCYIGQEVVLRATARGHLQKGLVQLELPAGAGPGAPLRAGGVEVGLVTSAAETPEGRLGLGYLRRAHWRVGERLQVDGGEAVVRRVIVEEPGTDSAPV